MKANTKPQVLGLGGNFAGLTTARFIRERCKDAVQITLMDRKPYLAFKEMSYRTGGKFPSWGIPLSELVADTLV